MQEVAGLRGITCLLRELQDAVRRTPPAREPFVPGPLPPGHDCGHELEGDRQRGAATRCDGTSQCSAEPLASSETKREPGSLKSPGSTASAVAEPGRHGYWSVDMELLHTAAREQLRVRGRHAAMPATRPVRRESALIASRRP